MSDAPSPLTKRITPAAAARRLGVSKSYLANLRRSEDGEGPAFYQIGRKIEYAVADIDTWLAERRRTTTARRTGPRKGAATDDTSDQRAAA